MVRQYNIILVNPSCLDKRISGEDAGIVPIGLYYIGALLKKNGFKTDLLNLADVKGSPIDVFKAFVADEKPDIIGFSVTNPNRWNAMECAAAAKKIMPGVTIVFGGPAPTFLSGHLLDTCPEIDFIVAGEGEVTFLELVKTLEKGNRAGCDQVKGLIFKRATGLFKTPPRQPLESLDTLVHPSKYFIYQHLSMTRGCPGKCTFCGSPKFWINSTVRCHSPSWFASEIKALADKGVSHFYISDDTFTMDRQRVIAFCNLIIKQGLSITWNAISRVDYIDEDVLYAMRKAGCVQLSFGVESGSDKIRKRLGKPIKREKIIRAFSLTASYGILPRAYFIYGSPGETDQTINESIDLIKTIKPLGAIFYLLVIYPGTHLYQHAVRKHGISDDLWNQKIEDLPWLEVEDDLDFPMVKAFGDRLRSEFYTNLDTFSRRIHLVDIKELYPWHADFLSRLAMTFSHGEYANDSRVKNQTETARQLYLKALSYAPDERAFLGFAMLHQRQKHFDKSISILEQGLTHHSESKDLNLCMGISHMNTGRYKTALIFLEKVKTLPGTQSYINICHQRLNGKPT